MCPSASFPTAQSHVKCSFGGSSPDVAQPKGPSAFRRKVTAWVFLFSLDVRRNKIRLKQFLSEQIGATMGYACCAPLMSNLLFSVGPQPHVWKVEIINNVMGNSAVPGTGFGFSRSSSAAPIVDGFFSGTLFRVCFMMNFVRALLPQCSPLQILNPSLKSHNPQMFKRAAGFAMKGQRMRHPLGSKTGFWYPEATSCVEALSCPQS